MAAVEPEPHPSVAAALDRVGQRYTRNRVALVEVLAAAARPLTIAEVLEANTGLPQSSVYRNLAVLEQAGTVRRVMAGDEFARYELAEDLTEHHHHLVCADCGSVIDFTMPGRLERVLDATVDDIAAATGFRVHSHRLDLVVDGVVTAAAVALPARGMTLASDPAPRLPPSPAPPSRPRLVVSRTRAPMVTQVVRDALDGELLPMGSAGAKAMAIVLGEA